MISIIIPCYNIEKHLPKCIESVLAQTYTDFELLLLNDGSTDGTLTVCENFAKVDSRIKVHTHENKGVSFTRNRGIEAAKGKYIMFVDGDDWIEKDYLHRFYGQLRNNELVICGFTNVTANNKIENIYYKELLKLFPKQIIEQKDFLKLLEFYSLSSPCAKIYEKKIITNNKLFFKEDVSYQEDLIFNLSYFKYVKQIILLNYFGYHYINHLVSSTNKWHKNFNHVNDLYQNLHSMISTKEDKKIFQFFLLNTVLRKIFNVYHMKSQKKYNQKTLEMQEMFKSDYFKYGIDYYDKSFLNILLKLLFKLKVPFLFFLYFKLKQTQNAVK